MDDGELWSFFRRVLDQGRAIQMDNEAGKYPTYEHLSARMDEAARERVKQFREECADVDDTGVTVPASEGRWMIVYEDCDVSPDVFTGEGAEAAARARYAQARQHWSVGLYQCVDSEDMRAAPRPPAEIKRGETCPLCFGIVPCLHFTGLAYQPGASRE